MKDNSDKPFFDKEGTRKYYTYCVCLLPEVQDDCLCKSCNKINIEFLYNFLLNRKWNDIIDYSYSMILPAPGIHTGIACVSIQVLCTKCDHLHLPSEQLCYFYPKCDCENGDALKFVLNVDAYSRLLQLGPLTPLREQHGM